MADIQENQGNSEFRIQNSEFGIQNSEFRIGFSPCPNDTFIFDAMIHGKIDTEGLSFDFILADVEELNRRAFKGVPDVTKLSYFAYAYISDKYQLLNSGSALGNNCGPLLISKKKIDLADIHKYSIAIPGKYTTANFLFSMAFPEAGNKKEMLFSEIENAILKDTVDAGVIIHENRFTYKQKGLIKLIDLGEYWEEQTRMPIPLGGIAIKRSLPDELKQKVDRIIRRSVKFALDNPRSAYNFIKANAQEMDDDVMYKHIGLYVNKFTVDIGIEGKDAVNIMFEKALEKKIITGINENIFV
ncbi:MAG: 1,4-dihydroxy-6-naphthoate synthase [Bacteroidales bacterium]